MRRALSVLATSTPTAALVARVAVLESRVAVLEAARSPRDAEDRRLRAVLAASTLAHDFSATDLLRHAALVDPTLADALRACTIATTYELGCWLRSQLQVGPRDGLEVRRLRRRRWQVVAVDTSDT